MFSGFDSRHFNPKKMQGMMKQLGIEVNELDGIELVILKKKNEDIVIEKPTVSIMKSQGNETYQINGITKVIAKNLISSEDIDFVCQMTGVSKEKATSVLQNNNGDIAESINELKNK